MPILPNGALRLAEVNMAKAAPVYGAPRPPGAPRPLPPPPPPPPPAVAAPAPPPAPADLARIRGYWRFPDTLLPLEQGWRYEPVAALPQVIPGDPPPNLNPILFGNEIRLSDVCQGLIGDCYLLVALHSMMTLRLSERINSIFMMEDIIMPDGTHLPGVVVKLLWRSAANVLQRHYIHVQYTVPVTARGVPVQNHRVVWPYILEKAYAAFRSMYPDPPPEPPELPPPDTFLGYVQGGAPHHPFEHLTGIRKVDRAPVPPAGLRYPDNPADFYYDRHKDLSNLLSESEADAKFTRRYRLYMSRFLAYKQPTIAPPDEVTLGLEGEFCRSRPAEKWYRRSIKGTFADMGKKIKKGGVIRRHEMIEYINDITDDDAQCNVSISRNPPGIVNIRIKEFLGHFCVAHFPGKRGSGQYTEGEMILWEAIRHNMADSSICCGTINKIRKVKKKGLEKGHAYQVCGIAEVGNLKFVVVRNPWLHIVRDYFYKRSGFWSSNFVLTPVQREQSQNVIAEEERRIVNVGVGTRVSSNINNTSPVNIPQGQFAVELTDFTKRFDLFTISESVAHLRVGGAQLPMP